MLEELRYGILEALDIEISSAKLLDGYKLEKINEASPEKMIYEPVYYTQSVLIFTDNLDYEDYINTFPNLETVLKIESPTYHSYLYVVSYQNQHELLNILSDPIDERLI